MAITLNNTDINSALYFSGANVGIGTSTPGNKLNVVDSTNCVVESKSTNGFASFRATASGTNASYMFFNNDGGEKGRISSYDDGALTLSNGTASTERMRVLSSGQVQMPYQPAMRAGPNDGWQNFLNETRGWLGTFKNLRGGFFQGGNPGNGYGVIHVPVTGYYWINMKVYKSAACNSRMYLRLSTGAEPLFIHTCVTNSDMTVSASVIYYLNADNWMGFRWAIGTNATAYYGEAHTEICATFLG